VLDSDGQLTREWAQESNGVGQLAGACLFTCPRALGLFGPSAASGGDEGASCGQDIDGPSQVGQENDMTGRGQRGLPWFHTEAGGKLPCFSCAACERSLRFQGSFQGARVARDHQEAIGQREGRLQEALDDREPVPQQLDDIGRGVPPVSLQEPDLPAVRSSAQAHALPKQAGDVGLELGAQLDKERGGREEPPCRRFSVRRGGLLAPS
jgi:hypothetical protein